MYDDDFQQVDLDTLFNILDNSIVVYCVDKNIDLLNISPSVWNYILLCFHDQYFKDKKLLINNNINYEYSIDSISRVYEVYKRLCYKYKQVVNVKGFTELTGVSRQTLREWGASGKRPRIELLQAINEDHEYCLENKLLDPAIKNPFGAITALNKHFGWSRQELMGDKQEVKQLGASDLQQLQLGEKREKIIDVDLLPPLEKKQGG